MLGAGTAERWDDSNGTCLKCYLSTHCHSGSGKTSLISVAADLIRKDELLEGSRIEVNGERGKVPKGLVGVVWQDDLLLSNLTVEENVYFACRLKTPESTSDEDVRKLVAETMDDLGLSHVRHSLVGSPLSSSVRGVSGYVLLPEKLPRVFYGIHDA